MDLYPNVYIPSWDDSSTVKLVLSSSGDRTIRFGTLERVTAADQERSPYEGMNITGVTGLTQIQRSTVP